MGTDQRRGTNHTGGSDEAPGADPIRNPSKRPEDWVTGDEPMTGPQESYLSTLAREAGEPVDENLTKAEASKKIDELQDRTGRGRSDDGREG